MNIVGTRALLAVGTLLVLGSVNALIAKKESIKRSGEVVYLELVPVDPRSLMQGDYMALNFQLARQLDRSFNDPKPREGETRMVDIVLDEKHIASFSKEPTATSHKLRYRIRKEQVWLGTNAFFFEERSGEHYEPARYGEFRLDRDSGEAVLTGLRDKDLKPLVAAK
jgi:uncharacterized membrane-anchored protein